MVVRNQRFAQFNQFRLNLIPLNHVEERSLASSKSESFQSFCRILTECGANYTVRRSLGGDVDASCGQLRRKRERNREKTG